MTKNEISRKTHIVDGVRDDGTKVRFECEYWAKDIHIKMISPYPGEIAGRHILFLVPKTYNESNWQATAWRLVDVIFERMAWKERNEENVVERRKEAARRCEIVNRHLEVLKAALHEVRQKGARSFCGALAFGNKIKAIKRNIRELNLILYGEREDRWIHDAMRGGPIFEGDLRWYKPPRDVSLMRVVIYIKSPHYFWGDITGWHTLYTCIINRVDKWDAGIDEELREKLSRPEYSSVNSIDMKKFCKYIEERHPYDVHLFEAWQEIAGQDAQWVAVVSRVLLNEA